MMAATAIRVRELAEERLTHEQKRRLAYELTLLSRISVRSAPDAICGSAVQDAVERIRKEMRG